MPEAFEIGFDRAGIMTTLQVEIDPWCREVLSRHWPDTQRVDDVRKVDASTQCGRSRDLARAGYLANAERPRPTGWWRGNAGLVDLIYGGFPCQDVSVAGNRAGLRGERSGLWHEFHRVLRELRPQWVVVENVPGLLSSNGGRDFRDILLGLEELGYGWAYRILDGRWFGVPQRRRRVFIVGCLGDAARAAQVLAVCESCGGHPQESREAREDVAFTLAGGSPETSRRISNAWNTTYLPDVSYALPASARGTGDGHGNAWNTTYVARGLTARNERIDAETENLLVASAVRSSDGHHGYSSPRGDGVRRLTPLECERLMGWPDDFTRWTADGREIPDSHRYRLCGNGVIATVAEWLGHRLMAVSAS